jgi:hypothetical protein
MYLSLGLRVSGKSFRFLLPLLLLPLLMWALIGVPLATMALILSGQAKRIVELSGSSDAAIWIVLIVASTVFVDFVFLQINRVWLRWIAKTSGAAPAIVSLILALVSSYIAFKAVLAVLSATIAAHHCLSSGSSGSCGWVLVLDPSFPKVTSDALLQEPPSYEISFSNVYWALPAMLSNVLFVAVIGTSVLHTAVGAFSRGSSLL